VDHAIGVVRSALAQGMDWQDLERLIQSEKQNGDPLAAMISGLDLPRNCIFLRLADPTVPDEPTDSDSDEEASDDERKGDDGTGRGQAGKGKGRGKGKKKKKNAGRAGDRRRKMRLGEAESDDEGLLADKPPKVWLWGGGGGGGHGRKYEI